MRHDSLHPGRFVVRTLSRIRTLIAADPASGGLLAAFYHLHRGARVSLKLLDLLSFFAVAIGAILFLTTSARTLLAPLDRWLIGGTALLYAAPYWIAFAHPIYAIPILPVLALFALGWASAYLNRGTETEPIRPTLITWIALAMFIAIQLEWVFREHPTM